MMIKRRLAMVLSMIPCSLFAGCGPAALSPGENVPAFHTSGWTNGGPPDDLLGKVVVLEVFASW